jgi:transcription termination factor NusB
MLGTPMTLEESEKFWEECRWEEANQALEGLEKPPEFDLLVEAVTDGRMTIDEAIEAALTKPQGELIKELSDGMVF